MSTWQVRLAANVGILLVIAVAFAGYVWMTNEDRAHQARVQNCIAINELSRQIYLTLADYGFPTHQINKFRPTLHCEELP